MDLYQQLIVELYRNTESLIVFGVIMIVLQWLLPAYKEQKNFRKSTTYDLAYSYILTISTPLFVAVPVAMAQALIELSPAIDGIYRIIQVNMSLAMQTLLAVVLIDFVSYWRHRIMHMPWLWPIHAIHHSSTTLTWLSTERFHIFNHVISSFISIIVVTIFFGPVAAIYSSLLRRFYNFFIHSNVRIDYGPLNYIFVSPRFHHWHHSRDPRAINCNYTTFFSFFDLIFGSYYLPKDKSFPDDLGENDYIKEGLIAHFLYPLRCWVRLLKGQEPRLRESQE